MSERWRRLDAVAADKDPPPPGREDQRTKRACRRDVLSRRASRIVAALLAAICLPVIGTLILISKTARPDLFDLTPAVSHSDHYVLLPWAALERTRHALNAGEIPSGTPIRALGYMMEGTRPIRDGEPVQGFILMPDVGNAWHPAHRFGDELIDVRLEGGNTVRFAERSLVWVWGTLQMLPGDPLGHEPLYVLEQARTEPAAKADIEKYFR